MKIPLFMQKIKPTGRIINLLCFDRGRIVTIDTDDANDLHLIMDLGKWSDSVSKECQRILQLRRLHDESRK